MKTTLTDINELKKQLDQLIIEKFVDELTFEDIKFSEQVHTQSKISYTKMSIIVPQCKVGNDKVNYKRVFVYLGKSSDIRLKMFCATYRKTILELMKDNIVEKFLNK